jgi:hypothetical protein
MFDNHNIHIALDADILSIYQSCFVVGFDSRHYQKKKLVGLERGPLSLVSTTEELLDRKVEALF